MILRKDLINGKFIRKIPANLKPMVDDKKKRNFLSAKSDEKLLLEFLVSYRETEKKLLKIGEGISAYIVLIQKLSVIDGES